MIVAPPFPQELIRKKRDGSRLDRAEIGALVGGISDGSLIDAQVGALAMAFFLRGLDDAETVALTLAMRDSGRRLQWPGLPGPMLDKHSTGGVGDKVSLILAPLVAACGGFVPMISGRGLGHTGGTLDKLESIPGYHATPGIKRFQAVTRDVGCAIIGQTDDLAPADRRLYAIRDVCGAVESIPLITASILSKKLAAGLDGLVMDVKLGSGAFIPELEPARELASDLVRVANAAGLPCRALLSDMNACLGHSAGNALEVIETIAFLKGERQDPKLAEVVRQLAAEMLLLGRLAADTPEALGRVDAALASGAAAEHFATMVAELGGPADLLERPQQHLRQAPIVLPVSPDRQGTVTRIDVRALGLAVVELGGGRTSHDQMIDHAVGLSEVARLGQEVGLAPLALVHARSREDAERAAARLHAAFELGPPGISVDPPPALHERIV